MLVLRSLVFNVLFYANLIALMVLGLPALLRGRQGVMWLAALWGRSSLVLLRLICGCHVEFRGLERIPPGPLLVAAKHQSIWEVFVLATMLPDFTYVTKRELIHIPLFGLYLKCGGQIAIDRTQGRTALTQIVQKAKQVLAEDRQFIIFPEGTRRPPGAPPQYKFGVSFLYSETGARCLPVALNSGLFWPRRSFLRRPGTAVIEVLEPIEPGLDRKTFLELLERRIDDASDRLLEEALGRDPSLMAMVDREPHDPPPSQKSTGKPEVED